MAQECFLKGPGWSSSMTAGPLHNHAPAHQLDLPCSLEISKKSKILTFLSCRDFDDIRKG